MPNPKNDDTNADSMEPPEVDNERVARRAARAKDVEPLDVDLPPGVMPSEVDVQAERQPAPDPD